MVNPTELKYFLEVAHSQNLSRASERLGISQPTLSTAIKRLEHAIGTDLMLRHKKGVTLTQAGKQLLVHAKQLLQFWENVKSQALASHCDIQGHYVLGCHPSVALHYLSGFLPQLLNLYPKMEIKLKHDISRKITEGVINLSIDIGIVVNPIKHPDLVMKKLVDDVVTFWQKKNGAYTNQNLKSDQAVILCDEELTQTQWLLKQLHKKGIKYARLLTSSNLEVIANLTAHGCGIGVLPSSVASSSFNNQLSIIPKMPVYHDEIYLIYRHENRNIKAIQLMIQSIAKLFKKEIT